MEAIVVGLRREGLFGIFFVVLNILDACLTRVALVLGSSELNPIAMGFGSSLLLKGLLSAAIVVALVLFKRGRLLKPLGIGMLAIVLWNTLAVWTWT